MTQFLFVDNFRGFTDAVIPLTDVNFLVGENSTGKTSLLSLVRQFMHPRMLFGPLISGDEDLQVNHFSELVSAHASNRTYFRVGMIGEVEIARKTDDGHVTEMITQGMLLTYKEVAGIPQIAGITCIIGTAALYLRWDNGKVLFKHCDVSDTRVDNNLADILKCCIAEHESGSIDGLSDLELPEQLEDIPLVVILSIAAQTARKQSGFRFFPPSFGPQLIWIAPIRAKPRRTYDEPGTPFSSEGAHTPYVIRRMLNGTDAQSFHNFMTRVGKDSGLFQDIRIREFGPKDDPTAPFEVDAVLDGKPLNLSTMGYGVSQSLPIIVELLDRSHGSVFAIQQPEVHLHPRAQAALGDVFFEMAVRDKKRFLVETHSDFTIDRFRMNFRRRRQKGQKIPSSQVLFFERRGNHNYVIALPIGRRGDLPVNQPEGYRSFFIKEQMGMLGV